MKKLLLTLLVIPLIVVQEPQAAGHLAQLLITWGAGLLDAVAKFLGGLLTPHH